MGRYLFILIAFLLSHIFSSAQAFTGVVKGILVDSASNEVLEGASISIQKPNDSLVLVTSISTKEGKFEIGNLDSGYYQLFISFQGYDLAERNFVVSATIPLADLQTIKLNRAIKTLKEVVVKDRIPVRIKGDTLSFNASTFKTKTNASAEDLLKKVPGVQVQNDGTIKAQGEAVQKIYVDGKEFFGNDPTQATRNLTADMIDRVEVFNERSDQSQFSGVDDGSRARVINLKLKKSKKNGLTGKAYAGAGTIERYEAGLTTNYFKGAKRIAVSAQSNNTNTTGSAATSSSTGTGNGGPSRNGGSPGINQNTYTGINYNDILGKRLELAVSYSFRQSENINAQTIRRQFFFADSVALRNQAGTNRNTGSSQVLQLRANFVIDSMNSLLYTPVITYQNSNFNRQDSTETFALKGVIERIVSDSRSFAENTGSGVIARHNLLYRRRFLKDRRTFSINLFNLSNQSNRSEMPFSRIGQYSNGTKLWDRIIQQRARQQTENGNSGISVSYTEPLGKSQILQLNYQHINGRNESERKTMDWNSLTGNYDLVDVQQSNEFVSKLTTDRFGTSLRVVKKTYSFQAGLALQQTILQANNITKSNLNRQRFIMVLPDAYFNRQISNNKSIQLNYNGSAEQPSPLQMQEVINKSSPLYWTAGNGALKQEFSNNYSIVYNSFDLKSYRTFFVTAGFSNTYNKIVNKVISKPELIRNLDLLSVDDSIPQGVQLLLPVNANGSYNLIGNINLSTPLNKEAGSSLSSTTTLLYSRDVNFADEDRNFTHNLILGQDIRLGLQFGENNELSLRGGVQYSVVNNTLQPVKTPPFVMYTAAADLNVNLPHNFILSTTFDYRVNRGLGEGYNQDFLLWNAGLSKLVFKNKKGEIRLFINDLLNKNQNIMRNTSNNSIEDIRNNVLRRYAMLSFVYHLSTSFKNKK